MNRRRLILGIAVAGTALICLIGAGAAFALRGAASQVVTPRDEWDALGIDHYAITVEQWAAQPCIQRLEVAGGRIVAVTDNSCPSDSPLLDVNALFAVAESYTGLYHERGCGLLGCRCGALNVDVTFSQSYHYPSIISVTETSASGLRAMLPMTCLQGGPYEMIFVTEFRELP